MLLGRKFQQEDHVRDSSADLDWFEVYFVTITSPAGRKCQKAEW